MRRPTPGRTASRSGKCTPKVARHHSLYLLCTVNTLVKYVACTTTVQRWFLQHHDISVTALCIGLSAVFEKTCATTQKNVKSHVFLKSEKNVKNVKKHRPTAYVQFHRPLNHSAFNTQLPKQKLSTCTGKSPTSHTLLRNADTRN